MGEPTSVCGHPEEMNGETHVLWGTLKSRPNKLVFVDGDCGTTTTTGKATAETVTAKAPAANAASAATTANNINID